MKGTLSLLSVGTLVGLSEIDWDPPKSGRLDLNGCPATSLALDPHFVCEVTFHPADGKVSQATGEEHDFVHHCIAQLISDRGGSGSSGTENDFPGSGGWNGRHTGPGLSGSDLSGSIKEEFTVRISRTGFSSEYSDLNIASEINRGESSVRPRR